MTTSIPTTEDSDPTDVPADLAIRGTDLGERVAGLADAAAAARGHVDDGLIDAVTTAAERATGRLRLSARHTVVAIAGATGSGKSSTYNALTGLELSSVGIRRPTTSWATAVVWGSEGAEELLEWLGIPPRHQTMRDSMLDSDQRGNDGTELDGVVLLDLPDHDSTEVSHHLEVDRLVASADLMVWILDPQKYADAAVHDRYFKQLTTHQDVILVALNHIDTVPSDRRQAMIDDVRRLLAADGLPEVPVLGISARAGIGMDALREEIRRRVRDKAAMTARVTADVDAAAARLEQAGGHVVPAELSAERVRSLEDVVAEAAGTTAVVEAIERTVGERARAAVRWPALSLVRRGDRPDEIDQPSIAPLDRSSVDTSVRGFVDEISEGLGPAWAGGLRAATAQRLPGMADGLDRDLRQVDLGARLPFWVPVVRLLHWVVFLAMLGGLIWWGVSAVQGVVDDLPRAAGQPLPAVIAAVGLVLGVLLAVLGRMSVGGLSRARADAAEEDLRAAVHRAVDAEVVAPATADITSYARFRRGIATARGTR